MNTLFYQLNNFLLLEYNLYDESNPVQYSAATDGWIRIKDLSTGTYQIINADSSTDTNSIRNQSSIKLSNNNWAWLNTTPPINYLDTNPTRFNYTPLNASNIDVNLNNSYNPAIDFVAHPDTIKYDTVRVHIMLGYDFSDVDGYIFEIQPFYNNLTNLTTSTVTFLRGDTWFTMNPNPINQNGKVYSTYIEFLVPSVKSLVENTTFGNYNVLNYINPLTNSSFNNLQSSAPFNFNLYSIGSTTVTPIGSYNYSFFNTSKDITISIPQSDQYELLGCSISEATHGDYFEYYATYNKDIIEDYILFLINSGSNWLIQHDIIVSEQVGHNWIVTENKSQIQLNAFDTIFTFRPVLLYSSSSVSYSIDYTIKLVNADKGVTVTKSASLTLSNTKKYGRKLLTIDLSTNPVSLNKVYQPKNAPLQLTNNVTQGITTVVNQTLPTFYERSNIQLSSQVLYIDTNGSFVTQSSDTTTTLWGLDQLQIEIDPFDNWFMFKIYQKATNNNVLMDLSGAASYMLIFNNSLKFSSVANSIADPTKGELLFKIDQNSASYIIKLGSGKFYINSEIGGQSTPIYSGFFIGVITDYATKQAALTIASNLTKSTTPTTPTTSTSTTPTTVATNTAVIPGLSTNDGASLKNIPPAGQ